MQVRTLSAQDFLNESMSGIVLDVRSPGEYASGHIPGAFSFPLFTDEERKIVGTLYKQQGREPAVEKGLELVGPKMSGFVKRAKELSGGKSLYVHCWRGGMRSNSMAWLLSTAGMKVFTLAGGYKSYRRQVMNTLSKPFHLLVLGGETGSGKTEVLHELRKKGEQVIDLEALAEHKGSSFGGIGERPQPTTENFANLLSEVLRKLNPLKPVWVEDESRMIGTVNIAESFYNLMTQSLLLVMQVPEEWRVQKLVDSYGKADKQLLISAFQRIRKKLGGQHLALALQALEEDNLATAATIALRYYDKAYRFGLKTKTNKQIIYYSPAINNHAVMADELIQLAYQTTKAHG